MERPKPPVQTHRVARRQDPHHPRQQLLPGDVEPHPAALHPGDARRLRPAPRHRGQGRQQGQLPHPPGQVQARGLDVQARARVRDPAELARRLDGASPEPFLEDANIDWDISKKKVVPRPVRPVQGALRPPGDDVLGRPAVRGPRRSSDERYNAAAARPASRCWGTLGGNKLDWRAMASNGNGRTTHRTTTTSIQYNARVMWQAIGATPHEPVGLGRARSPEGDLGSTAGQAPLRHRRPTSTRTTSTSRPRPHRPEEHHLRLRLHLQVQGLRQRGRVLPPRVEARGWPPRRRARSSTPTAGSAPGRLRLEAPGVVPVGASGSSPSGTHRSTRRDLVSDNERKESARRLQLLLQQAHPQGAGRLPASSRTTRPTRARAPRTTSSACRPSSSSSEQRGAAAPLSRAASESPPRALRRCEPLVNPPAGRKLRLAVDRFNRLLTET